MASPYAIAAVGKAILALLAGACPKPEFAGAEFELYQAKNLQSPMEEGIALYLHRITPANNIRNMPPRIAPDGRRYRPSLPIDIHFLLVPFARDAFKQQRLLGWAMRTIEDTPILHDSFLNQYGPEPDTFFAGECVDMILETIAYQDLGSVWDAAKPNIQPAVPYVVRMLQLDSALEMVEAGLVQTRVFDAGKVVEP
ncbi:MAG TPA: DUF4255 domain-containing protein [Thermoanaerobaculia bacterium]|jgi:hypothetical protein|nr:DUF4255 domain-containing protein [Thermoanaerobaculia bacterium]